MATLHDVEQKVDEAQRALYDRDDPATAARLFQELTESEPSEPLFHWSLGYALSEMNEHAAAIPKFQQALKLDPQNVPALGCLGRAHMELGEWEQAERAIRGRLALKESPQHYVFLANVLMHTDRYAPALECCRKAVELDPSFAEAYLNMGLAYRHDKRMDEAIHAFEKAVELDSRHADAFRELGLANYGLGKIDRAEKALRTCLALAPHDAWCHLYLALCLEYVGDIAGAANHFAEAVRTDPDNQFIVKKHDEFARSHPAGKTTAL